MNVSVTTPAALAIAIAIAIVVAIAFCADTGWAHKAIANTTWHWSLFCEFVCATYACLDNHGECVLKLQHSHRNARAWQWALGLVLCLESHKNPFNVGLPHKTQVLQCGFSGSCCA